MAELATEIAAALPQAEVRIFSTAGRYRGNPASSASPIGAADRIAVTRIRQTDFGSGRSARLAASLLDGLRLARRAASWADTVISLTDPPLQGYWMGRAARRHRVRWAEWTMDLYPEAFAAAGLARPSHPVMRALTAAHRRRAPDLHICLGTGQLDHLRRSRGANCDGIVIPAGLFESEPLDPPDWRRNEDRVVLAYAGNLGEAHSAELVARLIERAPPDRFLFMLAPHGARAAALRQRVGDAPHTRWSDRLDAAALDHADAHIVSLRRDWTHVCVPSKALSAFSRGRPVLFLGSADSDSWRFGGGAGWLVPEPAHPTGANGLADAATDAAIDAALAAIADPAERAAATEAAIAAHARLTVLRSEGLNRLIAWLRNSKV